MDFENSEIWEAMKEAKYRTTNNELKEQLTLSGNDLDKALESYLNITVNAIHAQAATIWYYDKFGSGRIYPKKVFGGASLGNISLAPGEGVAGQTIADNKALLIDDCQADPRWYGKSDEKTSFRTETMICVPLGDSYAFGCIQIINKTDGTLFDKQDLIFVEMLSKELSIFLAQHSSQLFGYTAVLEPGFTEALRADSMEKMLEILNSMKEIKSLDIITITRINSYFKKIYKLIRK